MNPFAGKKNKKNISSSQQNEYIRSNFPEVSVKIGPPLLICGALTLVADAGKQALKPQPLEQLCISDEPWPAVRGGDWGPSE